MKVNNPSSAEVIPMGGPDESFIDENFLVDLDRAFETIQIDTKKTPSSKKITKTVRKESEMVQMQATYLAVAQVHLKPVLRYLKAVKRGLSSRDICELVHFVIGPMILKTKKVGLGEQAQALISFQRELKKVLGNRSNRISLEQRMALSQKFTKVERTFLLDFRGSTPAVVNLLGFYKRIKKNSAISLSDIRKFFAIGVPSLSMIRKSSLFELKSLSGISDEKVSILRREARKFRLV